MGDYDGLEEFVHIAETPEAFIKAIEVAMEENTEEFKESRWRAILDRSWQARARQISNILKNHLQKHHGLKF